MNWLLYIGGGWLWFAMWNGLTDKCSTKLIKDISNIMAVVVWIWICWRVT